MKIFRKNDFRSFEQNSFIKYITLKKHLTLVLIYFVFFCFIVSMLNPIKSYGEKIITLNEAYLYAAKLNGTIKSQRESYYQSTLLKWTAISMLLPNMVSF